MIQRGHSLDNLFRKYTMDQVWLFYMAAVENKKLELLEQAFSMRVAFQGGIREWKKYVKMLEPGRSIKQIQVIDPKEKIRTFKEMLSGG